MKYPHDVQLEWLKKLVYSAQDTEWGQKYDYKSISTVKQFKERVPLQDYDSLKPYIERVRKGEQNIIWNSEIKWFAKSSGTTSDKSKFIPVSEESLEECHYKGGKDMLSIYCNNNPETKIFEGKSLGLGGSHHTDMFSNYESHHGDVSAIIMQNLPFWAEFLRAPDISIALMTEWEEKLDLMARTTMNENITSIAGVPSWMLLLLKHLLKISGKDNLKDVWPGLEVYFHGGVSFTPYKEQYKYLFRDLNMHYLETYNASEGFFGIQDQSDKEELLLMLDYGIFYEFLPMEEMNKPDGKTLTLEEVQLDTNYALVISTNAGMWRYMPGDTIKFTSLSPYRIKISGRTKHFINAFGEEVIIDNAENALEEACKKTSAIVKEYTAAPVYFNGNETAAHEWLIEFEKSPDDINRFTEALDTALKSINSDYEAKRYKDMILRKPIIKEVSQGTFYNWLKSKGKLGGQHKIPRLSNSRQYVEEILNLK